MQSACWSALGQDTEAQNALERKAISVWVYVLIVTAPDEQVAT